MKIRLSAIRGAPVMDSHFFGSVACTSQTFSPLLASTAISRPSSVPQMIFPFHTATPRFTMPQHSFTAYSPGTLRVVLPQLLAGFRIEGVDLAPGAGHENAAVDHDRRGLVNATPLDEIGVPGQAELRDVVRVDLRQRAEALPVVVVARTSSTGPHSRASRLPARRRVHAGQRGPRRGFPR